MNFPENLHYTDSHEWVKLTGQEATIGITDYAQSELGDIIFVETPEVGKVLKAGDTLGSIEAVKTVSDLYAPLGGEVTAVNPLLTDKPETINSDPYGDGWIVRMKVTDDSEKGKLLNADSYRASVAH
ncbi:MAG: glycine cleavage system protein GcvH [Bacteroidetes bacterium]|nr:glycine cleavage system protein GcvH [Bacteroidota bacterium]